MRVWWSCLGLLLWCAGCTHDAPGGPDIILLTVDTLRADHVRALAPSTRARTPNIDRLAQRGIRYDNAWSPISVTGPAFCTLHTGLLPGSHGVVMNLFNGAPPLSWRAVTLAERLKRRGYATGAFVSGFTVREALGLGQGFRTYDAPRGSDNRKGHLTADAAIAWLEDRRDGEPILLWFHSFDVHGPLGRWSRVPYESPLWEHDEEALQNIAEYQRLQDISTPDFYALRYAEAVRFADKQLGRILEALDGMGRLDDAIVVVVADHGESFTERAVWFDHGTTPFAEQLRVPLIVKLPGDARAGETISEMVGLQDVVPSLLRYIGAEPTPEVDGLDTLLQPRPSGRVLTGESSHCKGEQGASCAPTGLKGKMFSARDDQHALIRRPTAAGVRYELYDRRADPGERQPLDAPPPPALKAAVDALAAARARLELPDPAELHGDDDDLRALRELGYVE